MEIFVGFLILLFVFVVCVGAIFLLMNMTDTWDVFVKYYILKECRHDYSKWTQIGNTGSQQRECVKCGWVDRSYR
jgi:hypothetical protein